MAQPAFSPESEFNKARQCLSLGRLDEAEQILTRLKAVMAPHPVLFEYLGFIALQRQDLKKAARHYRKSVKLDASCLPVKMKLAEVLLAMGDEAEAVKLAQAVHRKDESNVGALNLLGMHAANAGDKAQAREHFSAAVNADPKSFQSWHGFGRFLLGLGEWQDAQDALINADKLRPDHLQTLTYLGRAQTSLGEPHEAIEVLKRAQTLTTQPSDYGETSIHLAEAYRRAGQLEQALDVVSQIQARVPGHQRARTLRATLLQEQGDHELALQAIRTLREEPGAAEAEWFPNYLEPQSLLSLSRHEDAAKAFDIANRQQTKIFDRFGTDKDRFIQYTHRVTDLYAKASHSPATEPNNGRQMAFVNGFPRSGTTLIDAILRTHSKVAIAEESGAAVSCWQLADDILGGGLQDLSSICGDVADRLRQHYDDQIDTDLSANRDGRVVVDRHATGLLQAGLMKHLYQDAEFFLMLRHPCDVVISAWFANFQPTDHTANYLTIEDTARFYDLMMTVHTTLEDHMGLSATIIRYEDLVSDLRGTMEPVLSQLGLEWEEQLESFHQSQHRPKRTVSFNQVSQPLYTSAARRFEHYQSTLEPVMPVLAPWIERFGYA
ncbi:MAG: sulfotransferase [Pseudomonadota bacterium]